METRQLTKQLQENKWNHRGFLTKIKKIEEKKKQSQTYLLQWLKGHSPPGEKTKAWRWAGQGRAATLSWVRAGQHPEPAAQLLTQAAFSFQGTHPSLRRGEFCPRWSSILGKLEIVNSRGSIQPVSHLDAWGLTFMGRVALSAAHGHSRRTWLIGGDKLFLFLPV